MNKELNTKTMPSLHIENLRESIQSYLSMEADMNRTVEQYQIAIHCENESEIKRTDTRIDLLEKAMNRTVKIECIYRGIEPVDFIDLVNEYTEYGTVAKRFVA